MVCLRSFQGELKQTSFYQLLQIRAIQEIFNQEIFVVKKLAKCLVIWKFISNFVVGK